MPHSGPIFLVEDDEDDQLMITQALRELGITNRVVYFQDGVEVIKYLGSSMQQPFLIICDINLPSMNGLETREYIENSPLLKERSIPFLFFTTSNHVLTVKEAYKYTVQGFFVKTNNYNKLKEDLSIIFKYWQLCLLPDRVT
ncbi:response regulator [Dyadobacter flavalbus]|uniref:Response regulator n=1 Tax=Dyadobacter flavalbus TaxID=2579942 RepID=A0A5M8QV94_9BACT|nr:response regulator [Dyadobacter flavalbus]KAA6438343.1 response regulator [Dyadobacter flavalbus]